MCFGPLLVVTLTARRGAAMAAPDPAWEFSAPAWYDFSQPDTSEGLEDGYFGALGAGAAPPPRRPLFALTHAHSTPHLPPPPSLIGQTLSAKRTLAGLT